jgi:hypothetical protein
VVARLDALPFLGADIGVSYYFANADQGQSRFNGSVPVNIVEADARAKWRGFEARAEIASVWIGGSARVTRALVAQAMPLGAVDGPVAHQLHGGYLEAGYNVLHPLKLASGMQLVPFLRYEHVDTQFNLAKGFIRAKGNERDIITAGLTFRPIAEVALKFDYQREYTDAAASADASVDRFNGGLAFMF